jgi:GTP cyclohydrolase I
MVNVIISYHKFIWLEEVIELVESCASCEIYSLLKRIDEKYVTEKAFDNPRFVEDIVNIGFVIGLITGLILKKQKPAY